MMNARARDQGDMERAIRSYLRAHPRAVDTERGIREWWLRDMQPRPSPEEVVAAIGRLVGAGELLEITLPDGQLAYQAPGPSALLASRPH
jgi:hypothetical protein